MMAGGRAFRLDIYLQAVGAGGLLALLNLRKQIQIFWRFVEVGLGSTSATSAPGPCSCHQ